VPHLIHGCKCAQGEERLRAAQRTAQEGEAVAPRSDATEDLYEALVSGRPYRLLAQGEEFAVDVHHFETRKNVHDNYIDITFHVRQPFSGDLATKGSEFRPPAMAQRRRAIALVGALRGE
jgi:hypothetical protein